MTGTEGVTRTYPAGVTCWIDTEQADVDAAQAFYSELFGWTFTEATPPGAPVRYTIAQLHGQDVAGLGSAPEGQDEPSWTTYVAVDDADAAAARVLAAGGEVPVPPADAGPGGRNATCTDPSGASFRLWQARRRLGAQLTNDPGTWNFSDLRSDTPPTAFYTDVFGWAFTDLGFATMITVPGYGEHLAGTVDPGIHERQAAVAVPPGFADAIGWVAPADPGAPPHWHVSFTVADRDGAAATVERLGGTVLATDDSQWSRTARVRDPQGAVFTASQFAPPE